jgi:hypothetical protein
VGLLVRRVLEVAGGALLPGAGDDGDGRVAMVSERLALVAGDRLLEVA